jgi:hypothetical protein
MQLTQVKTAMEAAMSTDGVSAVRQRGDTELSSAQ